MLNLIKKEHKIDQLRDENHSMAFKCLSIDSSIEHNNTLKYLWWWCLRCIVKQILIFICGSFDLKIAMNLNRVSVSFRWKINFIFDFGTCLNELVESANQRQNECMNKWTFEINTHQTWRILSVLSLVTCHLSFINSTKVFFIINPWNEDCKYGDNKMKFNNKKNKLFRSNSENEGKYSTREVQSAWIANGKNQSGKMNDKC